MNLIPERLRRFLRIERMSEDVHDFMGVVQIDPRYNVVVLRDHVAAILRVSGTDYLYAPEIRQAALDGWANMLNGSGLSVQAYIDRRPINWALPGGHLDTIRRQVDEQTKDPESWEQRRLARYHEALMSGEIANVSDLRQYVIIRLAMGLTEAVGVPGESAMYLPPRTGWRFWEQASTLFGGSEGRARWQARADDASRKLNDEVRTFMNRADAIPGFRMSRASALEISQLLHLLWQEDDAYAPGVWIDDQRALRTIVRGDSIVSDGPLDPIEDGVVAPEEDD